MSCLALRTGRALQVIIQARKPDFFNYDMSLYEVRASERSPSFATNCGAPCMKCHQGTVVASRTTTETIGMHFGPIGTQAKYLSNRIGIWSLFGSHQWGPRFRYGLVWQPRSIKSFLDAVPTGGHRRRANEARQDCQERRPVLRRQRAHGRESARGGGRRHLVGLLALPHLLHGCNAIAAHFACHGVHCRRTARSLQRKGRCPCRLLERPRPCKGCTHAAE
jgi:hypothetical protein